jgi:hypothetical protein
MFFATEVCSSNMFRDTIKPARFNTFETTVALDKIFSAKVNRTIVVCEGDTSATTDDESTNEKRKEKKEKS